MFTLFKKKSINGVQSLEMTCPLDRKLSDAPKTVSLSAYIHLLSGLALSKMEKGRSVEDTLHGLGVNIGNRILDRIYLTNHKNEQLKRISNVEEAFVFIQEEVWPYLFNKKLDHFIKNEKEEEYYLIDNDPTLDRFLYLNNNKFSNMHIIAGVLEAIMVNIDVPVETKICFSENDRPVIVIGLIKEQENQLRF